jgi:hypothetical protein
MRLASKVLKVLRPRAGSDDDVGDVGGSVVEGQGTSAEGPSSN